MARQLLLILLLCVSAFAHAESGPCVQTSHGCIATNPDVTQATIDQTICVVGYTKTVRPSTSYTRGVKLMLLRREGLPADAAKNYELDHLINLSIGGHPRKLSNLVLQPWKGPDSARRKDKLEVALEKRVCRGEMTLIEAQLCIAEDWHACAHQIGRERTGRHR
ncbi:MAG: hypothetical protein V4563_07630 [Pseudomonadota bacterium]